MPLRVQASSVKTAVAGSMYDSDLCQVSTVAAAVAMCFFDTAHSACVLHKFRRRRRRRRSRLLSPWHGQRHRINTRHKPDTRTAYSPCVCVCVCVRAARWPLMTSAGRRSATSHKTDKALRTVTGHLADATGDFACLVFVLLAASARPRVVQLPWEHAASAAETRHPSILMMFRTARESCNIGVTPRSHVYSSLEATGNKST